MTSTKKRSERKEVQPAQRDDRSQAQPEELERDIAATYNAFKEFEGRRYTGVRIGRGHKWYYDNGEWKERKVAPDKWEFTYAVPKRRAGNAPEGSGVPVGAEYHWYILAHQTVRKLNANDYTTAMTGMKYKLAHKRAATGKWSASDKAQWRHLIRILEEMIAELREGLGPQEQEEMDFSRPGADGASPAGHRTSERPKAA